MKTAGVCLILIVASNVGAQAPIQPTLQQTHQTILSLRWKGVVRQAHDFSCGTGSIANFLSLTGGVVPDEQAVIDLYGKKRGQAALQQAMTDGFSLLDLKLMLHLLGYEAEGFRYDSGTMPEDPQPMIVYLVVKGYKHFAVFAGLEEGQVVLLDPSRGRIRITQERFVAEWDGTALLMEKTPTVSLPHDELGLTHAQEASRSALFVH